MKKFELPSKGIMLSSSKAFKLDYSIDKQKLVQIELFKSVNEFKPELHVKYDHVSFKRVERLFMSLKQFEVYLYTNLWVDEQIEIIIIDL
jgi:hypothetical protein